MELRTHRCVTAALYASLYPLIRPDPLDAIAAFITAASIDTLLDTIGHEYRRVGSRIVARRSTLHSIPALTVYLAALAALYLLTPLRYTAAVAAAALTAHYALDLITEGGIPLTGRRRLRPPATLSYNDSAANTAATLAAIASILLNTLQSILSADPGWLLASTAAFILVLRNV